ncbi:hypothetical protein ACJA3J_05575 [Halobacillus sp. SY10]|uniref:hypothetical protein n=1 Tax=Halobacillus sp. SY10 TaxID=3381356 RepID=UPI003879AABA
MKKLLTVLSLGLLIIALAACAGGDGAEANGSGGEEQQSEVPPTEEKDSSSDSKADESESQDTESEEVEATSNESDTDESSIRSLVDENGEMTDPEFGDIKITGVGYSEEVGINGNEDDPLIPIEMGSMKLTIGSVGVMQIEPIDEMKNLFNGKNKVKVVVMDMIAENTSDEDVSFHPNQSTIVTDTGEQVTSDLFLSGEVGGDFYGKVTKEGQVWWILNDAEKEINNIKLILEPVFDTASYENTSEEKRVEFEVLSWEEAKEKDGIK